MSDKQLANKCIDCINVANKEAESWKYVYDPKNWEDEFSSIISKTVKELDTNMTESERTTVIDAVILDTASKMQTKYRGTWGAMQNPVSQYITQRNCYNALEPLYTQYPDKNDHTIKNKYVKAFVEGFIDGSNAGIVYGAMDWVKTANKIELPETKFNTSKLQHEFKHAKDFGVEGNWNGSKAKVYQDAIENQINDATDVFKSTYRGEDVYVYINRDTSLGEYVDLAGNYVGGWKFTDDQIAYHIKNGVKIN